MANNKTLLLNCFGYFGLPDKFIKKYPLIYLINYLSMIILPDTISNPSTPPLSHSFSKYKSRLRL
jgi:hypothetical protein